MKKANKEYQAKHADKMKTEGYLWCGYWLKPEWKPVVKALIEKLKGNKGK